MTLIENLKDVFKTATNFEAQDDRRLSLAMQYAELRALLSLLEAAQSLIHNPHEISQDVLHVWMKVGVRAFVEIEQALAALEETK